jgi:TM2 domain-containing membrane protein YozV
VTNQGSSEDQPTSAYPWSPPQPQPPGYGQPPQQSARQGQPPPPGLPPGYGQPPAPYPHYPPGYQVAPKNPGLSLLASFFIPGLGSMINGEAGKGVGILVGYLVSLVLVFVVIGIFGVLAFWIWGMVDAYQGAQKWNARHGFIS